MGIRDTGTVLKASIGKVLKVLKPGNYTVKPKQTRYGRLETDEFWTYAGKKENKMRLVYAYCRETGEIAARAWGQRGIKTVEKLRVRRRRVAGCGGGVPMSDISAVSAEGSPRAGETARNSGSPPGLPRRTTPQPGEKR
jgi:hypothetical protein